MKEIEMLEKLKDTREKIIEEIHRVIVGQDEIIEKVLIGLFSGGHCLLVGVPGLAKTLMIRTLSRVLDLKFKRIQFTPDLMPSDITGIDVIEENPESRQRNLRFIPGPIFANLVLADEINRAPPKTQTALLEAMQEYQVTVGNKTYPLEKPFLVLATQNPIELEGTYPLPEAQLDRFMMSIYLDYPCIEDEKKIAEFQMFDVMSEISPLLNAEGIIQFQHIIRSIPVSDFVINYAVNLVRNTRPNNGKCPEFIKEYVNWGAGPRATQYLILGAKTKAALRGDVNVSVSDIKSIAESILRHRIFTNFTADADGIDSGKIVNKLLEKIPESV
ncbi:MAG: ATPase RavA [candidate division TA06 bacterium ADurb.Bin131]|uniref:ATPase RavA n=1 Tax=candidate division TA06 bacterium ADurb.Bin131 TaxID=1852827 RepID=A0A1V6CAT3_UNCT6|nr:MAG: ATPase RavA [candidate division TA06 bacterium ADurb.Bin131]HOC02014.1 MoxR family ATPase [bacterium]